MTMTSATENLVVNQFPQPARPPNSYDMNFEISYAAYPQNLQNSEPSKLSQPSVPVSTGNLELGLHAREDVGHPQQSIDHSYIQVVPPMPKEEEGERKGVLVDKLVNRILEKYEKLPASIKDQINLDEMLAKERNRLQKSREVKSQSTTLRGLQRPDEVGIPEKLERFKIRTVVLEEVVKEDEKK